MKKMLSFLCFIFASFYLSAESGCMSFYRGTKLGKNPLQQVKQQCRCNCKQKMRDLPMQKGNRCIFCKHFRKPCDVDTSKRPHRSTE